MVEKKHTWCPLSKKAFTLVEMLIVIVIIGILAAALIPRLLSARGRANDTARKADLQQLGTALISYQVDNSAFPATPGSVDTIKAQLTRWGLGSIPADPDKGSSYSGINNIYSTLTGTPGQYMYTPIIKNGFPNWGFVLMARTETENGSNFVFCGDDILPHQQEITSNTDFDQILLCSSISPSTTTCQQATTGNATCTYVKSRWQLRYIYRY